MVLVGRARAEARDDAIAFLTHDVTVELANRVRHDGDRRFQDLSRFLGVKASDQLGRVRDIGEEDGRDLAFACRGGAVGETCLFGLGTRRAAVRRGQRLAAVAAEFLPRADRGPAMRTTLAQVDSARFAIARACVVLRAAFFACTHDSACLGMPRFMLRGAIRLDLGLGTSMPRMGTPLMRRAIRTRCALGYVVEAPYERVRGASNGLIATSPSAGPIASGR